ncbi:MAG TPA: cyanophycinase [Longimicrobiales bacterium]|nr:cyanophycinase [Longimicrobiales bacterium]
MIRHTVRLALCLVLLPSALAAQGRLVIAGGGVSRGNADLYRTVLEGRSGTGPICVIPTASAGLDAARNSMNSSVATFEQHGGPGAATGILMSIDNPESASDPDVVARFSECSGFYFTGGVQSRTVSVFRPDGRDTPALEALLRRYSEGALVGGSSAGAAIMSDPMIAGGSTTTAIAGGVRRNTGGTDDDDGSAGGVSITRGIGFLASAIVDQHFLARGRIGRLIAAVLEVEEFDLGFGVDEDTGLVVDGTTAFAAGASGVIVVDARDAVRDGRSATGVKLHLMGVGDRYDIASRRLTPDAGKVALPRTTSVVPAPEDVFARWEFLHLLERFARSSQQRLEIPVEGATLTLSKGADFHAAAAGSGEGPQGSPPGFTVQGLLLDVRIP